VGFIGLCFVRVLYGCCGLSVPVQVTAEMTYNDPAHSLTVFSLIPVWFVMAILSVIIN